MLRALSIPVLFLLSSLALAEDLPLSALLAQVENSAVARASYAEQDALSALRRQREAEAGWQWFAAAGAGSYRELVTDTLSDDYYGRDLTLGLRHPLLGSLRRQQQAIEAVELEQQRQHARTALQHAELRLALRSAYADWWRAQQEQQWCVALEPAAQSALTQIQQRLHAGWLLASEARSMQGPWQALQRRCTQAELMREETRDALADFTGKPLTERDQALAEPLASTIQPLTVWRQALTEHPRLRERKDELQHAERNLQSPWYAGVDSSFNVAQSYEYRSGADQSGDGLVASISVSTPFDLFGYGRDQAVEAQARHQGAQARLQIEREQLLQGLGQALRAQREAQEQLAAARERLAVARQAYDEQRLRRNTELDRGLQNELTAAVELQAASLALIGAWHGAWLREAALRLFVEDDARLGNLFGRARQLWGQPDSVAAVAAPVTAWRQGVYLWDSYRLLQADTRSAELKALRKAGMQRIYLGLTARQVADMTGLRRDLQRSLDDAHKQGLEVALLLGDPAWIEPGGRQGLLTLIKRLKGLPFDALHLDLEVEQLGWPVPNDRLQDWLNTLTAVSQLNTWPLEISSHHRWFAQPQPGQPCVPCAIPQSDVRQVSLMIYTRNPTRSAELAREIARRWPALGFRLAQSVEPQLTSEESWSGATPSVLQQQVQRWRVSLEPAGVTGIDWQDWTHYPRRALNEDSL